jgi:hypothetical protein
MATIKYSEALAIFHTLDGAKLGGMDTRDRICIVRTVSGLAAADSAFNQQSSRLYSEIATPEIRALIEAGQLNDPAVREADCRLVEMRNALLNETVEVKLYLIGEQSLIALMDANPDMPAGKFALLDNFIVRREKGLKKGERKVKVNPES